ncbi:MAG: RHS repeat protein, partial [Gammaproteobacteria bacterium]|nr:RHS repeat protein [Gammaproteobacteria bacterium]
MIKNNIRVALHSFSLILIASIATLSMFNSASAATQVTSYTYYDSAPKQGLLHTIDGPRIDVTDLTTLDYDSEGNLTWITNALGHSSQILSHDSSGRPLEMLNSNNLHTTFQYDVRGRLEQTSAFPDGETEANGRKTLYTYTASGDIKTISVPGGEILTYTYDDGRRVTRVTDSQGDYIVYEPDSMGNILSETIHASNNSISQKQNAIYNELGQLFQSIGAETQTTEFGYDLNGNNSNQTDARTNPTTQAFDALNRLKSTLDAKAGTTAFTYDNGGNINSVTDPRNKTTTYTYDGLSNLKTLNSPDTGLTTYNSYDAAGNLLQETNANG